jgi:hypothetical protein
MAQGRACGVTPKTWKVLLDEILEGRAGVMGLVDENLEGSVEFYFPNFKLRSFK